MDLAGVQARVRDVNPAYLGLFTWRQEDNIVKAYPKLPISELAFKSVKRVFRQLGGKFVSWRGQLYFELVLEENPCAVSGFWSPQGQRSGPSGFTFASSTAQRGVLTQTEARVAKLCRAGQELLEGA